MGAGMRLDVGRAVAGLLLVVVGVLLLLQFLQFPGGFWRPAWSLLFAITGLAFLALFSTSRADAWAAVPGFGLLGLAGSGGFQSVAPSLGATWGGSLFLGGIGLGFLAWYGARRDAWWTIIPAGWLLTLAAVSSASRAFRGIDTGGIFFLGLAMTFVAVYLLAIRTGESGRRGHRTWALAASVPFFALAAVVFAASGPAIVYVVPVLLIFAGLWLALRPAGERPVTPPDVGHGDVQGGNERPSSQPC